jgi:hypothetical protein
MGGPRPHGILGGLAAAFAVGRFHLRRAEDFFADLGLGARRALGLGRGNPCDTTLYRVLAGQSPVGFEESVFAQVKRLIAGKVVKNDRLKLGVMTFDGKGTWSRANGEKVEGARQSSYDAAGSSLQTFGALRATLTSSSVCPASGSRPSAPRRARRPPSASCSPGSATNWAGNSAGCRSGQVTLPSRVLAAERGRLLKPEPLAAT